MTGVVIITAIAANATAAFVQYSIGLLHAEGSADIPPSP